MQFVLCYTDVLFRVMVCSFALLLKMACSVFFPHVDWLNSCHQFVSFVGQQKCYCRLLHRVFFFALEPPQHSPSSVYLVHNQELVTEGSSSIARYLPERTELLIPPDVQNVCRSIWIALPQTCSEVPESKWRASWWFPSSTTGNLEGCVYSAALCVFT